MARVLVAGCGRLGGRVATRLADRGDVVWGLRRRATPLPAGVTPIGADLADPQSLADLPEVDAVIYTASADSASAEAYRAAYVDGQSHLLAALPSAPGRWLFTSSTRVYPQNDGSWVDESSLTAPWHFTAESLLAGEAFVRERGAGAVSLRLSGLYGPAAGRLVDSVRAGRAALSGTVRHTNRIHVDDAAAAVVHLLDLATPADLYVLSDCEPAPRDDVIAWLAEKLGVELTEKGDASAPGRPVGDKRCSNQRLLDSGFRFRYPSFREGYLQILDRA